MGHGTFGVRRVDTASMTSEGSANVARASGVVVAAADVTGNKWEGRGRGHEGVSGSLRRVLREDVGECGWRDARANRVKGDGRAKKE